MTHLGLTLVEKDSFFLLFNLFLLLFISPITLFNIIHGSQCIIFASF